MAIRNIDISNLSRDTWAIELAKDLKLNEPITFFERESCALYFLVRTELERVRRLKESEALAHMASYEKEMNGIVIGITPAKDYSVSEFENAFVGIVKLDDESSKRIIVELSKGMGQIYYIAVSADLTEYSAKEILSNQVCRSIIKEEVTKAGLL